MPQAAPVPSLLLPRRDGGGSGGGGGLEEAALREDVGKYPLPSDGTDTVGTTSSSTSTSFSAPAANSVGGSVDEEADGVRPAEVAERLSAVAAGGGKGFAAGMDKSSPAGVAEIDAVVHVQDGGGEEVTLNKTEEAKASARARAGVAAQGKAHGKAAPYALPLGGSPVQHSPRAPQLPSSQTSSPFAVPVTPSKRDPILILEDFAEKRESPNKSPRPRKGTAPATPRADAGGGGGGGAGSCGENNLTSIFCGVADIVGGCAPMAGIGRRNSAGASDTPASSPKIMAQGRGSAEPMPALSVPLGRRHAERTPPRRRRSEEDGAEEDATSSNPDPTSSNPDRPPPSSQDAAARSGPALPPDPAAAGSLRGQATADRLQKEQERQTVEKTIGNFLGGPGTWCNWQAWSVHMSGEDGEGLDPSDVKRVLRNRAGDLNSRRKRINRLSRDLSPFDLSAKRAAAAAHNGGNSIGMGGGEGGPAHGSSMPPLVPGTIAMKKAKSFAGENGLPTSSRPTSPTGTDVASSVASMTSSVCSAMQNCEVDDRPQRLRRHQPEGGAESADAAGEDEDLCYDSDPGDVAAMTGQGRRSRAAVEDFFKKGGSWAGPDEVADGDEGEALAIDPQNDDHVTSAVESILHRRMTLIWHRSNPGSPASKKDNGPVAVYAWIELGSQLRSALIQPKLMWKPVLETENERGSLGLASHINLHSVDLLDISRILAPRTIDRKLHPLAKQKCSLTIETFDHNLLFEARDVNDRAIMVQGLKGLVSRLASKIIVGDEDVFDEYFQPFGAVPGEAPKWAQ